MQQKTWSHTLRRWRFPLSAAGDVLFWYTVPWIAVLVRTADQLIGSNRATAQGDRVETESFPHRLLGLDALARSTSGQIALVAD